MGFIHRTPYYSRHPRDDQPKVIFTGEVQEGTQLIDRAAMLRRRQRPHALWPPELDRRRFCEVPVARRDFDDTLLSIG
jgi:hypothetical protein